MPEPIVIEWAADHLRVLAVDESLRVRVAAHREGGDHADPAVSAKDAGEELRRWLEERGLGEQPVTVVLPREAVVVRRLHLPHAPEDELPDLVRFQAATKTSSPIDELALDFLTLPRTEESAGQDVVTFTIDRRRLSRVNDVLSAAGLTVTQVTISPLAIGRLVRQAAEPTLGMTAPALVIVQQGPRIELSIFDEGTLVFSHATLLPEGAEHLKPLKSELSRSLVALTQAHPGVSIERCFFIGVGDESVQELLEQRFPGQVQRVSVEAVCQKCPAGYESLIGASLPETDGRLSIDLLHPRRKKVVPDRRRLYAGIGGAAAALLLLIGYGLFQSKKGALEANLEALREQRNGLQNQLQQGQPRSEAHRRVATWVRGQSDPITLWNDVRQHLPETDKLYLAELRIAPQRTDVQARFTGIGFAKQRGDVDQMNQALAENGFRVIPHPQRTGRRDPDYPVQFELDVELLRPEPNKETGEEQTSSGG
jgi:hypothetical protein